MYKLRYTFFYMFLSFSDILCDIFSCVYSDIVSDVLFGILSDLSSNRAAGITEFRIAWASFSQNSTFCVLRKQKTNNGHGATRGGPNFGARTDHQTIAKCIVVDYEQ